MWLPLRSANSGDMPKTIDVAGGSDEIDRRPSVHLPKVLGFGARTCAASSSDHPGFGGRPHRGWALPPTDVEIGAATRDSAASPATLSFSPTVENQSFMVQNTVVNKITPKTGGEGPATGEEVEIDITFTPPIFLPPDHYFFRPEVQVTGGNFLYLSAPRPIVVPPGTSFPAGSTDLQSWIRNENLRPDWLRIGTDIIDGATPPTFNAVFSLAGDTIPDAGTPGKANCHGKTISAMAHEFGGIAHAALNLGYFSVDALQEGVSVFCRP